MALRTPVAVAGALLGGALAAWIVTFVRMRGMDAGPGAELGGLGWYLGIWVTMTAAMMLPATAPMVVVFSRVSRARRRGLGVAPMGAFVAGYLVTWTFSGLVAYGLLARVHGERYLAGVALVAAGLYELTPLKEVCLRHCRGPVHFVHAGWRDGPVGALQMGSRHGLYCVGCCSGLMLALFALGVMSLSWMAVIAVLIFVQKVLPLGDRVAPIVSASFVVLAAWVVVSP
jgi:predicted metal-binding membrane protein